MSRKLALPIAFFFAAGAGLLELAVSPLLAGGTQLRGYLQSDVSGFGPTPKLKVKHINFEHKPKLEHNVTTLAQPQSRGHGHVASSSLSRAPY